MELFSFSDMNRASGEILEAALIEPVTLTKRGKESSSFSRPSNTANCSAAPIPPPIASRTHPIRSMPN
ncbi:hypothetical protein [Rhizobium populisoli]|uniref:hypothetical protein n=1 Tax=Rhizobium populisoli TaxID=2859785 RepID=UPI001FEA7AA3|nr:hypothetical protein [Rhizobium populisoli]